VGIHSSERQRTFSQGEIQNHENPSSAAHTDLRIKPRVKNLTLTLTLLKKGNHDRCSFAAFKRKLTLKRWTEDTLYELRRTLSEPRRTLSELRRTHLRIVPLEYSMYFFRNADGTMGKNLYHRGIVSLFSALGNNLPSLGLFF
jgi:hypothetical protein